jgi:hypothetical protein
MMMNPPNKTPWGDVQHKQRLLPGVWFVSTAGHGGIWLSEERRKQIPLNLQNRDNQWYEEDCEFSLVVCALRDEWPTPQDVPMAELSVREWFPEAGV